jgi:hypothetical protein
MSEWCGRLRPEEQTMETTLNATWQVIDAISRDSSVIDDPRLVADALRLLYGTDRASEAIHELLNDPAWSQDREPYQWLADVEAAILYPMPGGAGR